MNVGLFFGSFNPIHNGHLILAQSALNMTDLDRVWFVVSPQNPFKKKKNLLSEYDRYTMVEMAVRNNDNFRASNIEFSLPKPSFTIDTLTHLADRYRSYKFALIMGQDNLTHFHKWKNYEAILNYYRIFVYPRGNEEPNELVEHPNVELFEAPLLDISATFIRKTIQAGRSVRYLVPDAVYEYLGESGVYRK